MSDEEVDWGDDPLEQHQHHDADDEDDLEEEAPSDGDASEDFNDDDYEEPPIIWADDEDEDEDAPEDSQAAPPGPDSPDPFADNAQVAQARADDNDAMATVEAWLANVGDGARSAYDCRKCVHLSLSGMGSSFSCFISRCLASSVRRCFNISGDIEHPAMWEGLWEVTCLSPVFGFYQPQPTSVILVRTVDIFVLLRIRPIIPPTQIGLRLSQNNTTSRARYLEYRASPGSIDMFFQDLPPFCMGTRPRPLFTEVPEGLGRARASVVDDVNDDIPVLVRYGDVPGAAYSLDMCWSTPLAHLAPPTS
ncbi:hypothetical protein PG985_000494 [Apiospora marii]|uniref:Uncharacterized protein n=1 Tax=Apiospora marii TaxID=335849 RepID=A0ABR1R333_9PEZI